MFKIPFTLTLPTDIKKCVSRFHIIIHDKVIYVKEYFLLHITLDWSDCFGVKK